MNNIKAFKVKADGNDLTFYLGFVPDYLRIINVTKAAAGNKAALEWFGPLMGDGVGVEHKVVADNGTTGNLNINYAASGSYVAKKDTSTISNSGTVYGTATVQAVGRYGFKLTASGFMADNDDLYVLAIQADIAVDLGDTATVGDTLNV